MPSFIQHHFPNYLGLNVSKLYCLFWHKELPPPLSLFLELGMVLTWRLGGSTTINRQQGGYDLKSPSKEIKRYKTRVSQRMDQGRGPMKIFICHSFDENNQKNFSNISYKEHEFHCLILQIEKLRHVRGMTCKRVRRQQNEEQKADFLIPLPVFHPTHPSKRTGRGLVLISSSMKTYFVPDSLQCPTLPDGALRLGAL